MNKKSIPIKWDFVRKLFLNPRFFLYALILTGILMLLPYAYAENIVYTNSYPTWYEYDCTDSNPSTWTQSEPNAHRQKYFSFTDGSECHVMLLTYNLVDIKNIENITSVSVLIDSKSMLLEDDDLSDQYTVNCELLFFGDPTITNGIISQTPTIYNSFSCTGTNSTTIQEITIPYSAGQITTFETDIQAGNFTYSLMVFPDFDATMRTGLVTNGYTYAIGKFANELDVTGDGFNCAVISASNWCNFYDAPWEGVKKALGEDYIGDWFYVLVFMPLPMSVFLLTRNGTYAGFISLPIILVIHTIDQVIFEVSLTMIALAFGFTLYEIIRKKLVE